MQAFRDKYKFLSGEYSIGTLSPSPGKVAGWLLCLRPKSGYVAGMSGAAIERAVQMERKPSISPTLKDRARKLVASGKPKAAVAKELGFSRQKLYDILNEQSQLTS